MNIYLMKRPEMYLEPEEYHSAVISATDLDELHKILVQEVLPWVESKYSVTIIGQSDEVTTTIHLLASTGN